MMMMMTNFARTDTDQGGNPGFPFSVTAEEARVHGSDKVSGPQFKLAGQTVGTT